MIILAYVLVHHTNCPTSHHESISKAAKAYGLAMQFIKYALHALYYVITNDISSWILAFSSTWVINVLVNIVPSTPPMKGVLVKRHFHKFYI
jgi:hypothetical protein